MKEFKGYLKGINFGGWLSQCVHTEDHYRTFITEDDVKAASSWGIDHIRIPVDYDLVETRDGVYREQGFVHIQNAVDWCKKYRLHMILDLHKTFGYSFDDGEGETGFFYNKDYQERFYRLWEEFAKRFGKNDDMLAFELLNEVTKKEYCEIWNEIALQCIKRIRAICPSVKILVGGYYNNSITAVPDLYKPYDENIVYNFHCYEPLIFTHQGASWIPTMDTKFRLDFDSPRSKYINACKEQLVPEQINFPDAPEDSATVTPEYFENLFAPALKTAQERNVALYCGEYGVINLATAEDTLKWYRVINSVFTKYGIGRAAWSYKKMDFGLSDAHLDSVRKDILECL